MKWIEGNSLTCIRIHSISQHNQRDRDRWCLNMVDLKGNCVQHFWPPLLDPIGCHLLPVAEANVVHPIYKKKTANTNKQCLTSINIQISGRLHVHVLEKIVNCHLLVINLTVKLYVNRRIKCNKNHNISPTLCHPNNYVENRHEPRMFWCRCIRLCHQHRCLPVYRS